jgi:Domain of unknown function (DUF4340)
MKKLNIKILITVLVVLAGIFVLSRVYRSPRLESNLHVDFLAVDTLRVSEVVIIPANQHESEIHLTKSGNVWNVTNGKIKAQADSRMIQDVLTALAHTQTERMISRKKEKWGDFKVGEEGTHVTAFQSGFKAADFYVGKTGFTPAPKGSFGQPYAYVRQQPDVEVYTVNGFFEGNFNRVFSDWRNKTFLTLKADEISEIAFNYPADSGFVALKKDSLWLESGRTVALDSYLSQLTNKSFPEFADNFTPSRKADATIRFKGTKGELATVEAWKDGELWIMESTVQKGVFFKVQSKTANELLIGKKKLLENKKAG